MFSRNNKASEFDSFEWEIQLVIEQAVYNVGTLSLRYSFPRYTSLLYEVDFY